LIKQYKLFHYKTISWIIIILKYKLLFFLIIVKNEAR